MHPDRDRTNSGPMLDIEGQLRALLNIDRRLEQRST